MEAHFILGFEKFDLICTALISSLPHFWLLAGKETVFHEQTVYPISMVQTDSSRSERGRKVKHRELLGESRLIGHNSFSMRGPSETESGSNPLKISRLWSLFLMYAKAAHI